jgi:hypothetical protein
MRYPLIVALALGLAFAFPAPARAESYLSLLWADRPVCLLLQDCSDQWRVRVRYNLEWQPPTTWSPALFLDGDVLLRGSNQEAGHFKPLHGDFGGGVRWHFNGLSVAIGGTSGHFFDRGASASYPQPHPPPSVYNYVELRWER